MNSPPVHSFHRSRSPHPDESRCRLGMLHSRQDGAVVMLALAGLLILVMFGLMVYDAGMATKEKTEVQAASDFAALTQASAKARAMNMITYANIAKRSIWAVHSLYPAHLQAYRKHVLNYLPEYCQWNDDGDSKEDHERYHMYWEPIEDEAGDDFQRTNQCTELIDLLRSFEEDTGRVETEGDDVIGDFINFSGRDIGAADKSTAENESNWAPIAATGDGNSEYHYYDLKALDNHQRFVAGAASWWGWTEQLMNGVRNGATITASSPPPPGIGDPGDTDDIDRLPVLPPSETNASMQQHIQEALEDDFGVLRGLQSVYEGGVDSIDDPFLQEHIVNNIIFIERSGGVARQLYDCELNGVCGMALSQASGANAPFRGVNGNFLWEEAARDYFAFRRADSASEGSDRTESGVAYTANALRKYDPTMSIVEPWLLDDTGHWGAKSSNIVVGYKDDHRGTRGQGSREKYDFAGWDREDASSHLRAGLTDTEIEMQEAVGYFGMARGEIIFADPRETADQPDLWHPAWTARLRPVSLPDGENLEMVDVALDIDRNQETIAQLQQTGVSVTTYGQERYDAEHGRDFQRLEWMLRAIDSDTSGGIVK